MAVHVSHLFPDFILCRLHVKFERLGQSISLQSVLFLLLQEMRETYRQRKRTVKRDPAHGLSTICSILRGAVSQF